MKKTVLSSQIQLSALQLIIKQEMSGLEHQKEFSLYRGDATAGGEKFTNVYAFPIR